MLRLAGARWGHSQCSVRGCISYAVEQVAARPRPTGRVAAQSPSAMRRIRLPRLCPLTPRETLRLPAA